ncbi:MAG TPA: hypothetical protein VH540_25795 [Ktedonobacterales bacterium]
MAAQDEPLRPHFAEPEDEGPVRHSGPLSPEMLPAQPPAPKQRMLTRFITLKGVARVISLLGLLSFSPGVFIFSLKAWGACFDICSLDLAARLTSAFRHYVVPGFALTLLAWGLCLLVIARSGNWWRFAVMVGIVVVSLGYFVNLNMGMYDGNFYPTTEAQNSAFQTVSLLWIVFAALFSYLPLHQVRR